MHKDVNKSRNIGVDLFRCLCIYGICVYHAFFTGDFANGFESRIWTWCVPGFAFISGYYGVTLRVSKLLRLWVMAFLCFILPIFLGGEFLELLFSSWYLLAYTILLLVSPILNAGLNTLMNKDFRLAFCGVMILATWSWLSEFALSRNYIPRANGLGMLSISSLIVAYVLGFAYKHDIRIREKINSLWLVVLIPLSTLFGHYTSPITLFIVIALFQLFERMEFSKIASKIIMAVSSAGFAVYVLHTNRQVFPIMHRLTKYFIVDCHIPRYISLMLSALVICVICVIIYHIVITLLSPLKCGYGRVLNWLDVKINGLLK